MADRIEDWLQQIGLEEFAAVFAEQRIDHEVLAGLTDEGLDKLGDCRDQAIPPVPLRTPAGYNRP